MRLTCSSLSTRSTLSSLSFVFAFAGVIGFAANTSGQTYPTVRPDGAALHSWLGVEYHEHRRLNEANREYARALALDPGRELTAEEWTLVRRFAPRLYTTPTEFFGLRDAAVVVHPDRRLIAYHLFWDDDIDFPEDGDPCDHEVIWVAYAPGGKDIEQDYTSFPGLILAGAPETLKDARANGMRPRINVQWGKHGSIPFGSEQQRIRVVIDDVPANQRGALASGETAAKGVTIAQINELTFRKLSTEGARLRDHGLARRMKWPLKFEGTSKDYHDYSKLVDPIAWFLAERSSTAPPRALAAPSAPALAMPDRARMGRVSRWNSATISQHFLSYNFRAKLEWPPDTDNDPTLAPSSATLASFQLPAKTVWDKAMPRYPNLWVYIDASLAASYQEAMALATGMLRQSMRMEERFGPFSNPEACDFEAGLEHLQPWQTREDRALQHGHAFHIRYYYSALERQKLEKVTLQTAAGPRAFYRLPTSAHYEVEHHNPHHADVEKCPICGRTGEYEKEVGNLVEKVHDPLGVELAVTGTIRGEKVTVDPHDPLTLRGAAAYNSQFAAQHFTFPAGAPDQNTLKIGVIVITPPTGR
jgi:hypothetical protein